MNIKDLGQQYINTSNLKHKGIRYPCDQCPYEAIRLTHLKRHRESKHEGNIYLCDQCEYTASSLLSMKMHTKYTHDEMNSKYTCDECEAIFINRHIMKRHIESMHKGIGYPSVISVVVLQHLNHI